MMLLTAVWVFIFYFSFPNSHILAPNSQFPFPNSQISYPKSSEVIPESFIENIRVREFAVHQVDYLYFRPGTGDVIRQADDLLMEDVLHPCFLDTGDGTSELIHPNQRHLVAYLHPGDHRVDAIKMQLIKIQSHLLQEIVTRHLEIVLIVGIVHMPLRIALVVTHLHRLLKYRIHINNASSFPGFSKNIVNCS